jgi:hypothetical protein
VVVADTGIHELIVDRATEAMDALVERGDVAEYRRLMGVAWAQMGFDEAHPIRPSDRPTALDKIKTILIKAYADRERISFQKAHKRLKRMVGKE